MSTRDPVHFAGRRRSVVVGTAVALRRRRGLDLVEDQHGARGCSSSSRRRTSLRTPARCCKRRPCADRHRPHRARNVHAGAGPHTAAVSSGASRRAVSSTSTPPARTGVRPGGYGRLEREPGEPCPLIGVEAYSAPSTRRTRHGGLLGDGAGASCWPTRRRSRPPLRLRGPHRIVGIRASGGGVTSKSSPVATTGST